MIENEVTLKLKSSWKWIFYGCEFVALSGFLFLLVNLINVVGIFDAASIFLLIVFAGGLIGCVLAIIFANKHEVHFKEDGIVRTGLFRTRFFPFEELEAIRLAPRFWDFKSGSSMLFDPKTLVFDYRYQDLEKAVQFIEQTADLPDGVTVYFDQEKVVSG